MGFLDSFRKKTPPAPAKQTDLALPETGLQPETPVSRPLNTRMPIDQIYAYLRDDYEKKGYDDAICNPDHAYKDINKTLIHSNLEILFKQVVMRYEDDLRDVEYHIQSRTEAGLLDLVEQLKTRKETYEQHILQLKDMDADLKNKAPYLAGMLFSYERGFLRGLAAISLATLKKQSDV